MIIIGVKIKNKFYFYLHFPLRFRLLPTSDDFKNVCTTYKQNFYLDTLVYTVIIDETVLNYEFYFCMYVY